MGCLRFQVFLERVKNQKAKQKDPKGRGHWQSASVLSPYQLLALSTPLFSWVLYSRGLDMCLSWLYHLWEEFKLLFFHWTRPTLQLSTLVIPGSKEKVLKPMGASKRVVKENVKAQSRTLLQMPQTAIYNVTSFMESFLHFGRKFSMGKTTTSQPSSLGLPHYVDSKETEMLRDLHMVLCTMREQIQELVRRQERRRQRHSPPPTCTSSAQGSKQDAYSPL